MKNIKNMTKVGVASLVAVLVGGCATKANASAVHQARTASIVVQEIASHTVVLPNPIQSSLNRDASLRLPNCEDVAETLTTLQLQIEACQDTPETGRCQRVQSLVRTWGENLGVAGVHSAQQYWTPRSSTPLFEDLAQARQEAQALGYDPASLRFPSTAQGEGAASLIQVSAPASSNWAPVLKLMNYGDEDLAWDPARSVFSTRSHVLGCALLSGEVSLSYTQNAKVDVQGSGGDDAKATLYWELYEWLVRHTQHNLGSQRDAMAWIGAGVAETSGVDEGFLDTVRTASRILRDEQGNLLRGLSFEAIQVQLSTGTAQVVAPARWSASVMEEEYPF